MFAHQGFPASIEGMESPPPRPRTSEEAQAQLLRGHAHFRDWVQRIHAAPTEEKTDTAPQPETSYLQSLFPIDRLQAQEPFAIAIGCADARVPMRMLLGSAVNDIFEIRVAGQALADECLGSVDYAVHHLPTVKTVLVLGHSHCGAVKATVDNYLQPCCLETSELSIGLEAIVNRIFGSVVQAERALRAADPELDVASNGFRERLTEVAVLVNAALIAHRLEFLIKNQGREDIGVDFGVYDLQTHAIVHPDIQAASPTWSVGLASAPDSTDAVGHWADAAAKSGTIRLA